MNESSQTDTANVDMDSNNESEININAQVESDNFNDKEESLFQDTDSVKEEITTEKKENNRPEYWPEDLWDQEMNAPKLEDALKKIQNSEKMAEDMRRKLSKKDTVPEKYEYEGLPEEFSQDEGILNMFSNAAKEAGLSNHQANTVLNKWIQDIHNEDSEFRNERRTAEMAKLGDEAENILMQIKNFADVRTQRGTFSQAEADALLNSITTAEGARALAKAIELTGEMKIPSSIRMQSQTKTIEDIRGLMTEAYKIPDRSAREKQLKELREQIAKFEN